MIQTTTQWSPPFSIALLLGLAVLAILACALLRWASGGPLPPARYARSRGFIFSRRGPVGIGPMDKESHP